MGSNYGASQVVTGARALFLKDNEPIAYAGNVDGSEEVTYEPIDVINNIFVQEHAPTGYRATMNASIFRVPNSSLKKLGLFPKTGSPITDIIQAVPMTVVLQDSVTNVILAQFSGVKASNTSFSVAARGVWSNNISFVAIRAIDESEIRA